MKLRGLLTSAMAAQVVVTSAALFASYAATGPGFGMAQVVALLASGASAVLLARYCTRAIEASQQKRAAVQLAEQAQVSAQITQAVIKTALDAFVQTDERGIILEWSFQAEALTGWTRKEALGIDVVNLLIAEPLRDGFRQRMMRLLPELTDTPIGIRFEATLLHREGEEILIEASSTALQIGGRTVINNFVKDVTQKRVAEERLIQAQKMEAVGQLTGGVAHEFNNMLAVITGTIEILADAVKDDPPLATIAKLISEAADRGAALTSSLLSFARKQALQPSRDRCQRALDELAKLLRATFDKKIEIVTQLDGNAWLAFADRGQLERGAAQPRDQRPRRHAGGRQADADDAQCRVRRARGRRGRRRLCRRLCRDRDRRQRHRDAADHPRAHLRSVLLDQGRRQRYRPRAQHGVRLRQAIRRRHQGLLRRRPRHQLHDLPAEGRDQHASPAGFDERKVVGGTETILCVEDDRDVRQFVTVQLESLGYRVIPAANAAEALAIAAQGTPFDLLFTDIVMAGALNGRELADEMVTARPSLRVLFTSGYAYDAPHGPGHATMGAPLLTKPYRKAELARMLRRSLDTAVDAAGDPIPTPYSVQADVEIFLRKQASEDDGR